MLTHPIGQVWGGVRTYGEASHKDIISAVNDFVENNDDPKAAIIATFEFLLDDLAR